MKKDVALILLVAGFSFSACDDTGSNKEAEMVRKVPVTELIEKDVVMHHEYVTDIQALQNVEIRARVDGYLDHIYVDEGQDVRKGQLLFKINDDEYKAQLAKAKAILETEIAEAKALGFEVDRTKVLVEKSVISESELAVAEAKLKAAKAKIDEARSVYTNAQLKLSYTSIKAPYDGVISRIPLKTGSLIAEGTLLTTVSDISSMYAYFEVSEKEYLEYAKSKRQDGKLNHDFVELILADGSKYTSKGKVQTMEGEFAAGTGSMAFRAQFPNPEKILKHGSTGRIRLTNTIKDALILPQKAAIAIQDKNFVYVVNEKNEVSMKSFVPKSRISYFFLVEEGLDKGETVVYEGLQGIKDGSMVDPMPVSLDSLFQVSFKPGNPNSK